MNEEVCVCTPRRDQLINQIMARVTPATYEDIMQQVTTDLMAPQRDKVYELVQRKAAESLAVQREIDASAQETVQRMRSFVNYEDRLEDEAYQRNSLFDSVERGYLRNAS